MQKWKRHFQSSQNYKQNVADIQSMNEAITQTAIEATSAGAWSKQSWAKLQWYKCYINKDINTSVYMPYLHGHIIDAHHMGQTFVQDYTTQYLTNSTHGHITVTTPSVCTISVYINIHVHNNLIFFETSQTQMTEQFSLGWESNQMALTFHVSTLTARPLRHLSVTVLPSNGLLFTYHCSHLLFLVEDPLKFHNVSQDVFIW